MVLADMPFKYLDVWAETTLANYFPCSQGYFGLQHRVAVLCYPYKMVLDVVYTMRPFSIRSHFSPSIFWKVIVSHFDAKAIRLKGEGFRPGEWK